MLLLAVAVSVAVAVAVAVAVSIGVTIGNARDSARRCSSLRRGRAEALNYNRAAIASRRLLPGSLQRAEALLGFGSSASFCSLAPPTPIKFSGAHVQSRHSLISC